MYEILTKRSTTVNSHSQTRHYRVLPIKLGRLVPYLTLTYFRGEQHHTDCSALKPCKLDRGSAVDKTRLV